MPAKGQSKELTGTPAMILSSQCASLDLQYILNVWSMISLLLRWPSMRHGQSFDYFCSGQAYGWQRRNMPHKLSTLTKSFLARSSHTWTMIIIFDHMPPQLKPYTIVPMCNLKLLSGLKPCMDSLVSSWFLLGHNIFSSSSSMHEEIVIRFSIFTEM